MPLPQRSPSDKPQYVSRSVMASRLRFLDNTCDSMALGFISSLSEEPKPSSTSDGAEQGDSSSSDTKSAPQDTLYMPGSTENHCCALLHGLQELRKSNTFCDYSLVAEGQKISVHKAVMAACSDYFRIMLTSNMRESKEEMVELKGVTAAGLTVVVDFAYTGRLELTTDNVEDVLSAASHLQVSVAVELCSRYLEMALTIYNCTDILNLAQMYSLISTQTKATQFIMKNFEIVSTSEQYCKLTHIQLAGMLKDNSLHIPSEYRLFCLVLKWINHNQEERSQHLAELMMHVRLPLLAGEELVEKVSKVEMMRSNQECSNLLTDAKDYHIVTSKQPMLQTSRTQVRSQHPSIIMLHSQNLECYTFHNKLHGFLRDAPIPLFNPSVAILDNFMYACGGRYDSGDNSEIATARCFRYDPRFDSWYELPAMNEARKDFVVVALEGKLYAIGGQDENMVMRTVESYKVSTEEWEMCPSISHSCYGHAGTVCQGKIYITGGQRFSGFANNTSCFHPDLQEWEDKAPMKHGRCNHVMAEVQSKLYVVGGNIEDSYCFPVPIIIVEVYNPSADQWTVCRTTCNIREAGAAVHDDKIYIVGGINGEHRYSDLLQEFDCVKDTMVTLELSTRVIGRACCVLTLPHYLSSINPL